MSFCSDVWCGGSSLKSSFPSIFHLALKKNRLAADHVIRESDPSWNLFLRRLNDWEVEEVARLLLRLD